MTCVEMVHDIYLCRGCNIGVNNKMRKEKPAVAIKINNNKKTL